jgi:hypothetical protein
MPFLASLWRWSVSLAPSLARSLSRARSDTSHAYVSAVLHRSQLTQLTFSLTLTQLARARARSHTQLTQYVGGVLYLYG